MKAFFLAGLLLSWATAAPAAPRVFSSGSDRVALVELYTSEGCSSCPPADQWLTALRDSPGLWKQFVPVAFHVDYWNGLGWTDRFANKAFTQREYALAATWKSESVYTPCFVRDGAEWKAQKNPQAGTAPAGGKLTLQVEDAGRGHAEFTPGKAGSPAEYTLHVALLGSGFTSRVTAGENRGEILRHDFVALGLVDTDLRSANGTASADLALPASVLKDVPRRAVAAWVTRRGSLVPLQATGGWLE